MRKSPAHIVELVHPDLPNEVTRATAPEAGIVVTGAVGALLQEAYQGGCEVRETHVYMYVLDLCYVRGRDEVEVEGAVRVGAAREVEGVG